MKINYSNDIPSMKDSKRSISNSIVGQLTEFIDSEIDKLEKDINEDSDLSEEERARYLSQVQELRERNKIIKP